MLKLAITCFFSFFIFFVIYIYKAKKTKKRKTACAIVKDRQFFVPQKWNCAHYWGTNKIFS